MVKDARARFYYYAVQAGIPPLTQVVIIAQPLLKSRRSLPDVAACYPTVKAAIDGIVDAKVIADDTDRYLKALLFLPAEIGKVEGLRLTILPAQNDPRIYLEISVI